MLKLIALIVTEPKITTEELQNRRDAIAEEYFDLLPFTPYPVQEEALLSWFTSEQGVLAVSYTHLTLPTIYSV